MPQPIVRPFLQGLVGLALLLALPAWGHDYRLGPLHIEHPWSRATAPGVPIGVGYLVIVNEGGREARLVGATSPAAGRVTLHRSIEENGSVRMEPQKEGVVIPAGGRVAFEPGDYHLMLMQLDGRLEKGDRVPVTLDFGPAGTVEVELQVRGLTAGVE